MTQRELADLVREADRNHDGEIDFNEFLVMMVRVSRESVLPSVLNFIEPWVRSVGDSYGENKTVSWLLTLSICPHRVPIHAQEKTKGDFQSRMKSILLEHGLEDTDC